MRINDGGQGAIRVGSCNSVVIRNCLGANITTEDSAGNSSQNIFLQNVIFAGGGLVMGGSGVVEGCDWSDYLGVGAQMYGNGWVMFGNRFERGNTAYQIGLDSAGTDQGASGWAICGGSMEGNWTGMDLAGTCTGFYVAQSECRGTTPTIPGSR